MAKTTKAIKKIEPTFEELLDLTNCRDPKPEHMALLKGHLDEQDLPALVRVNESSNRAFNRITDAFAGSGLIKELYRREKRFKRKEMGWEEANVMVKMLIDQVIILHVQLTAFQTFHVEKTQGSISLSFGCYLDKMLSGYQRRFNKACETLSKVRKLYAEAAYCEERAKAKSKQATLASHRLYKSMSSDDQVPLRIGKLLGKVA